MKTVFRKARIGTIFLNPEQPRKKFDQTALEELAESIKEHGVIEPLAVEKCIEGGYILHDGERRLRAARMVNLKTIPIVVVPPLNGTGPRERLERALISNIQREEMHPIEEGMGYRRLMREFGYTQREVARRMGKHITRVNYCLTLLKLDKPIRELMMAKKLPSTQQAVTALLDIPSGRERVKLAKALAEKRATSDMIVRAARAFLRAKRFGKKSRKGSPAKQMINEGMPPEWDALFQLGKVPPWPVVTESVMATCDACPLRSIASDLMCRDCALPAMLKTMMEVVHVRK